MDSNHNKNVYILETTHKKSKRLADIFAGLIFILLFIIDQTALDVPLVFIYCLIGVHFIISTFAIWNIKKPKVLLSHKLFPYKSIFIGVDYWPLFLMGLLLGITQFFENESLEIALGILVILVWMFDLVGRIVKNSRKLYNVYFDEDRIIINENQYDELLYVDILSIDRINENTFSLFMKNHKEEKVILNIDRISTDFRAAFIREIYTIEAILQLKSDA